jgi:Tfp pilus assembly protein PilV
MQRKDYILRADPQYKKTLFAKKHSGFAMIMALIVIVIVSTIMAISLSLTTETTKRTVDLYIYEQTALHAKSAAELTMLQIAQNGCINSYNTTLDNFYDVNVTMRYIYNATVGTCTDYFNITTPEQNGSVLMDITVSVNDSNISSEPIRYFRRTIQKL